MNQEIHYETLNQIKHADNIGSLTDVIRDLMVEIERVQDECKRLKNWQETWQPEQVEVDESQLERQIEEVLENVSFHTYID
tara:strand:+ start:494 stop:736 length:243 start_codon:yes stop_codon:yes gene_type:complete